MRTYVYVDGFNLYFGLRNLCGGSSRCWQWLNVAAFTRAYVPTEYEIARIRYFTANVKPGGSAKQKRQAEFLRALRTIPDLSIHYGKYEMQIGEYPLAEGPNKGKRVKVHKIEEKRSDVNLASLLLLDTLVSDERPEAVVVISNDSDLLYPIKEVRQRGFPVGIINPHPHRPSGDLQAQATFYRRVRAQRVFQSQFPETLTDRGGDFTCPERWRDRPLVEAADAAS